MVGSEEIRMEKILHNIYIMFTNSIIEILVINTFRLGNRCVISILRIRNTKGINSSICSWYDIRIWYVRIFWYSM